MTLYSVIFERERVTTRVDFELMLGSGRVVLISLQGMGSQTTLLGFSLMATTGIFWSLYSVRGRNQDSCGYAYITFLIFGASTVVLDSVSVPFLRSSIHQCGTFPIAELILLVFIGTVMTALGYIIWNRLLKKISSSQAGLVQFACTDNHSSSCSIVPLRKCDISSRFRRISHYLRNLHRFNFNWEIHRTIGRWVELRNLGLFR